MSDGEKSPLRPHLLAQLATHLQARAKRPLPLHHTYADSADWPSRKPLAAGGEKQQTSHERATHTQASQDRTRRPVSLFLQLPLESDTLSSMWRVLAHSLFLVLALLLSLCDNAHAIKFELIASKNPKPLCIWNYALADTLAIISINVVPRDPKTEHDQRIDVRVVDRTHHSVYLNKKGLQGETRLAINTHHNADLGVCLSNHGSRDHILSDVDLDVHLGGEAIDYNAIANQESLSGMETELRKLAAIADEILEEMEYLKQREMRMSSTQVSTHHRVHGFSWLLIFSVIGLGVWQVYHLHGFFKRKYLID